MAKLAGVSKVTVSYVLNGHSVSARISPATQEKVSRAADELGYRPSVIARSMVTGRAETIGVVFQDPLYFAVRSDFIREVMHGVNLAAVSVGYDLLLHTKPVPNALVECSVLTDGRVDGVLILRNRDDETLRLLLEQGFPSVLFFSRSDHEHISFVDCDNYGGAVLATEHLVSLGHRQIGMVLGHHASTSSSERLAGYCDTLNRSSIEFDGRLVMRPTPGNEFQCIRNFIVEQKPTAIFCISDLYAIYTLMVANDLGLRVPEELSVVGFDSLESCERSNPPLTSVRQPVLEIARKATEILVSMARNEKVESRRVIFPTELDIRQSTAPPIR
ncbi:MAG: LacI family DNA-binding transcriptional regulator [Fimbriimonas sp.]|nr:LacI family DNA-binding transcriptional regulator [Fimbriimonas sp.]